MRRRTLGRPPQARSRQHPRQGYRRGLPYVGAGGGKERAARRFFVRVIWQESRFNALAVSPKGAHGMWRNRSRP